MIMKEKNLFLYISVAFLLGLFMGGFVDNGTIISYPTNSFSERQIVLAAVDTNGNGIAVPLEVEVKHGEGKVLTDIDKLLFWVDTQHSIQTARDVAENVTGVDTSKFDLIYSLDINNTGVVGGPSAGASLTIATIAALTNKTIKHDVVMTGTINEDGTIGGVGNIVEKAGAAKDIGVETFLIPEGYGTETKMVPKQICTEKPGFTYCETRYENEVIDIGDSVGIEIIEVKDINEAMNYFFE